MKLRRGHLRWVIAVASALCACAAQAAGWDTLEASRCKAVDASAALPDEWSKYRGATRICPLTRNKNHVAKISLISVFVDDYYLGLPKDAPWESFPSPMLVDQSGHCLARLSHQFPSEPPSQLVIRFGGWKQGMPTRLRLDVLSPTAGGNYRLPSLQWDAQKKSYRPALTTTINKQAENTCP